ncbi:transglutaminase family protein [Frankia sp. AgB1.9]|uniref:transglutaminase-like domain-containing protein n=1 Tax=unclassified Frankia TaxID=2632575 RepID=UPI0019342B25|nr:MULTISPECIES: transglutaminase family protein [unclassified Frankia]MBL7487762.1 transglutaminase family protein [Frankia sp. AgW1.1]MBL7547996.1 transglutaminase family protein [Frankia sp. AgB1.9]MBL7622721.1 transglutaminase family protein [Frankia sp. AgB1.8]
MTSQHPANEWARIPPAPADSGRVVSCDLVFGVDEPADIAFQIAVARSGRIHAERLDVTTDARPLPRPTELAGPHGGRLHLLRAPRGTLSVSYRAELVSPEAEQPEGRANSAGGQLTMEQLTFLRPSRYCPSDHVVGLAVAEFGRLPAGRARVEAITDWIHHRVAYVVGSSAVHDSAEDTLLTGQGVCRDFAHLGITLCRALEVPARFAAVYAPGLDPMDFHAVFEAWIDGGWRTYDATRKVPRSSLVRIATGRDAADAAFADVLGGFANLQAIEVTATVTGNLPVDDHSADVHLY